MEKQEKFREIITIAIYRDTHKQLIDVTRKDENFKDKFQEIMNVYLDEGKRRKIK